MGNLIKTLRLKQREMIDVCIEICEMSWVMEGAAKRLRDIAPIMFPRDTEKTYLFWAEICEEAAKKLIEIQNKINNLPSEIINLITEEKSNE